LLDGVARVTHWFWQAVCKAIDNSKMKHAQSTDPFVD